MLMEMKWKPIRTLNNAFMVVWLKVGDEIKKGSLNEFPNARQWAKIPTI